RLVAVRGTLRRRARSDTPARKPSLDRHRRPPRDRLAGTRRMRRRPEDPTVVFPRGTAPPGPLQRSRLAPTAHGRGWLRRDTRARAHAAPSDAQDHSARRRPGFAGGAAVGCAGAPLLAGAGRFRQARTASRLVVVVRTA